MAKPELEKKAGYAGESSFELVAERYPPRCALIPDLHERTLEAAEAAEEKYFANVTGNPVLIKPTGTGPGGLRIRRTKKKNPKSAPGWDSPAPPINTLLRTLIDEAEEGVTRAGNDPDIITLRGLGLKHWRHGRREIVPAQP